MKSLSFTLCLLSQITLGCGKEPPQAASPAAPLRAIDLTRLPAHGTFQQACARCHGSQGALYSIPFHRQGQELRQVVREMMTGPAGLENPTDAQVDQMLEYHLAIRRLRLQENPAR